MEPPPNAKIREAYERFGGRLLDYAHRILKDRERADDTVQETFLRLCRERYESIEPRLAEWLYTVCRNCAIDSLRKEKRMISNFNPTPDRAPVEIEAPLDFEKETSGLLQMLSTLPDNQREVLYLKFQMDLSYREIAKITNRTEGYVGFLIHAGMKQLREQWSRRGENHENGHSNLKINNRIAELR